MNKLYLSLKEIWYRMIVSGVKKEEYREITPYWIKRLLYQNKDGKMLAIDKDTAIFLADNLYILEERLREMKLGFKPYDYVEFTLGYPSKCDSHRRHVRRIRTMTIGYGNPSWGAEAVRKYFIIKV